ncbi:MAG TPA: cation-translocating P-type ATPase [Clostridiaceae bacterium]|jgi:Ca2+-transporting ATPase|nr:cation-translocating P-type ATPase [Clostridiaceae bacterium]HBF77127.1 cation-translocating P-type ATPase [Clostridiaceae bacterium]HBG38812.1 cation-translocating P-type ATPase [Clostridiaceae bacterium]HBN28653.1 cation-translocating P-type ATPase [Clostridiaceae bacterium]HBX47365.1 cation-translocating P-type ATPase [Clostridiaceae bacterium]
MQNLEFQGLTSEKVKKSREKYGLNEFVKKEKPNPFKKFIGVFKEPMFLLLIGTSLIYFLLKEPEEAAIMLIFVAFVATITFIQEWRTEKTIDALKELTSPQVTVLRNGKKEVIKSEELVPGDIVFLAEGERIPADCEVLHASNFSVDESVLTGESEPVFKVPIEDMVKDLNDSKSKDYWRKDIIYAGTLSIFGKCVGRVKTTGFNTEYGKISKAISEVKEELTPLQKKTHSLVKNLAFAGAFLCLLVIILSYLYNHNLIQSILSGITLAMAIIPEEFPVVLTVFLSLGAFRLAKKNTLVRKISAVETLGSATILAVDKTGTITKNIMEVKNVFLNNKIIDINKFNDSNFSRLMIMSCERDPYDPMEKAIINSSKNHAGSLEEIYNIEIAKKIPFDSKTKRMANIYKMNGKYYAAFKGSPGTILPLCRLDDKEEKAVLKAIDEMALKGLRVLAFADLETDFLKVELEEYSLNFKGLVGLQDPPKEGVKEAIGLCKSAGIRVVMITGDYSKTAVAIGNEIGLKFKNCAVTGEEIDNMTDEELCEAVRHCDIFSRVIPEHKMRIVKALKRNGEIVAMTGDGVNDAPALKSADIGIAMGKRGTEVAKEAAHMILMDDNFTTIVNSVKDGRRIYDNIRKAMVYIMVIHIPIVALALFSPIFNLPQILLPVHIVLLELIIDPTCSIIFEGEEAEPYIMEQPPRSPNEPILTKNLTTKVILQGLCMFAATFFPFHYMVDSGAYIDTARSFSLVILIVSNVTLVLVNRSNTQYLYHIFEEAKNTARLLINSIALAMVLAIVYIPFLQPVFRTKPLSGNMLLTAFIIGFVSTGWWELIKLLNKKTNEIVRQN